MKVEKLFKTFATIFVNTLLFQDPSLQAERPMEDYYGEREEAKRA